MIRQYTTCLALPQPGVTLLELYGEAAFMSGVVARHGDPRPQPGVALRHHHRPLVPLPLQVAAGAAVLPAAVLPRRYNL